MAGAPGTRVAPPTGVRFQRPSQHRDSADGHEQQDPGPDYDRGRSHPDAAHRASVAEYEETYLDWTPDRRKSGLDMRERNYGAVRRLRRRMRR